jgi:hypothetical protein
MGTDRMAARVLRLVEGGDLDGVRGGGHVLPGGVVLGGLAEALRERDFFGGELGGCGSAGAGATVDVRRRGTGVTGWP